MEAVLTPRSKILYPQRESKLTGSTVNASQRPGFRMRVAFPRLPFSGSFPNQFCDKSMTFKGEKECSITSAKEENGFWLSWLGHWEHSAQHKRDTHKARGQRLHLSPLPLRRA